MIWVGSFKSLRSALHKRRFITAPLKVHTWVGSEIGLISPLVDWLSVYGLFWRDRFDRLKKLLQEIDR